MAIGIDDFVRRLTRTNRRFTFVFTEDFFNFEGTAGHQTDRYVKVRNLIRRIRHHKGTQAALRATDEESLFDVRVAVVHNRGCYMTTFQELASGPFGSDAQVCGYGTEIIDTQKAKFLVESFFSERKAEATQTVSTMLAEQRGRQVVLIVENASDLRRPSLETVRNLRHRLITILVSPDKGPVVDCQVMAVYQEGNSNTLSALLNNFCVKY